MSISRYRNILPKLEFFIENKYKLNVIFSICIAILHYDVYDLFYSPITFAWSLLYSAYHHIFIINV